MNKFDLLRYTTIGICSAGLVASLHAQDAEGTVRVGETELRGSINDNDVDISQHAAGQMGVTKMNKASELIGMDVRNHQNEKLGEIQDLVLDLQSGKLSYAVLSVGGFLGIGDKYVAVPPSAFEVGLNNGQLVLNADKDKIENAPGFAKSNWPDVRSPNWRTESAYWLSDVNAARGTAGAFTSGTERDLNQPATARDRDRLDRTDTLDQRNVGVTGQADLNKRQDTFKGQITAINPEARTVSIAGEDGTKDFKVAERAVITLKSSRNPRLIDFKVGYPVTVTFHEENGENVVQNITRTDTPEVR